MAQSKSQFTAQLIAALEDAEASAGTPKPRDLLAQAAWSKLQFDFPVVSPEELEALVHEYASGSRQGISPRFLAVLRESAGAAPPAGDASPAAPALGSSEEGGSRGLVPLYKQLYAVVVVQCMRDCLEAPQGPAAAGWLPGLQPGLVVEAVASGESALAAEGSNWLEEVLAAAAEGTAGMQQIELEHRLSQQEDDDSTAYEPLEQQEQEQQQRRWQLPGTAIGPGGAAAAPQQCSSSGQAGGRGLPGQLAQLAEHLQYHCMSDSTAWRELRLMQRLAGCLAAVRGHPQFLELQGTAQPLLRLATDRIAAQPSELEGGLPALLDALGMPISGSATSTSTSRQEAAVAATAAELALAAAVALAAQVTAPSARRRLWQEVHQRLLPVAAQQLEQQQVALARQARSGHTGGTASAAAGAAAASASEAAQPSPQQLFSVMLPCQMLYFYVLQAASAGVRGGGGSGGQPLQEALLNRGGLLRSLVLLFVLLGEQPGAEALRCALLLACAAAQPLADWAAAVPGFRAAAAAPELQPGGGAQLHGALWRVLLDREGRQLAELLGDATPADKVPAVYQALQLMADVAAVWRRGPGQAALRGGGVEAALRQLGATLREQYGKPAVVDGAGTAAAGAAPDGRNEGDSDSDDGDAKKMSAAAAGEQAGVLAARRARQLQPACLKLVKDLLQAGQQGCGSAGKHD